MSKAFTREEFIQKSKEIHGNKYDYSLVEYSNARTNVILICPKHGNFNKLPQKHLDGSGCKICAWNNTGRNNSKSSEDYFKEANEVHNFKYDYSKSIYTTCKDKMCIICPLHGEFWQIPSTHLVSGGCKKCANILTSSYQKENPNGWSLQNWEKVAQKSKYFDSFKLYILECWNEEEIFYKIGRTYRTVKERFRTKSIIPYDYKILKEVVGEAEFIFNLENMLKNQYKDYKYIPKLRFNGRYECFSQIKL